ncbi:blast:Reticulocyte-binding protein 2 homolog a [Drosophila guanche]|uniref:Blast:Reticulocyte-binding protein 2 homolog a n=1 Tax=Drosophila guanche TaxID=7266 RepID=A0A3B0K084_DROGU|nr:blast:Reticulocyte-binding protein 2 homolog a [Drosophila guanche]
MSRSCCRTSQRRSDPTGCIPWYPRMEPVRSCSCQSPQGQWWKRNCGTIQVLANAVDQSASSVCTFLYQLTLNLFSRILNPLTMGWNTRKVPFVMSNTFELYYGIFDENGDLRRPMPARMFLLLLIIMQRFLCLPCRMIRPRAKCGHSPIMHCTSGMGVFGKLNHGIAYNTPHKVTASTDIRDGLRRLGMRRFSSQHSLDSDDMPYGYAPAICCCRGPGTSGPLPKSLRPTPGYGKSESEAQQECEKAYQDARDPIATVCPQRSLSPRQFKSLEMKSLSDFYGAVCQGKYNIRLLDDLRQKSPRITPCEKRIQRRVEGGHIPILLQKPLQNTALPWRCKSPYSIHQQLSRGVGGQTRDEDYPKYNNGNVVRGTNSTDNNNLGFRRNRMQAIEYRKETSERINPYMEGSSGDNKLDAPIRKATDAEQFHKLKSILMRIAMSKQKCTENGSMQIQKNRVDGKEQSNEMVKRGHSFTEKRLSQHSTKSSILRSEDLQKSDRKKSVRFTNSIEEGIVKEQSLLGNSKRRQRYCSPKDQKVRRMQVDPRTENLQLHNILKRGHRSLEKDYEQKRVKPVESRKQKAERLQALKRAERQEAGSSDRMSQRDSERTWTVEDEIRVRKKFANGLFKLQL